MAQIITKRAFQRQAFNAVHNPPSATQPIKAAKHFALEKNKMVKELVPFLMYLYKKYMDVQISESIVEDYINQKSDQDLLILHKSIGSQISELRFRSYGVRELLTTIYNHQNLLPKLGFKNFKQVLDFIKHGDQEEQSELEGKLRKLGIRVPAFEGIVNEDINIPISVGDTILGGKFKNKRVVVKSIGKNEKGDITINGKPLLKYRLVSEANAVSGGKVNKFITGKNLTLKGKKYSDIEFEVLGIDNKSQLVKLKVLAPKDIFGQEMNVPFKTIRRGPFLKTDTSKLESVINEIPMDDLKDIDRVADKFLNPVDVVLTDRHFFDRLNDPRNGKEISQAELIGFFKRLSKHKKEFVEFLNKYQEVVATDDRTNINIPFMKQANKAIAKTIMRKNDFKTSGEKLEF